MFDNLISQFPVGREGDVLLLYSGVHASFFNLLLVKVFYEQIQALLKNLFHSFFPDPLAEVDKVTGSNE